MQRGIFNEIIKRFYFKDRFKFRLLFIFSLFAGFFEYAGLILIYQFVLFLSDPKAPSSAKIIAFFNDFLSVSDLAKISLILGVSIASIYILKNIYMLFFTKYNNSILQDLSVKITLKIAKNLMWQDYLTINKIKDDEKLNIISKITIIVWQYCLKYVNLVVNIIIVAILISYLFIKFTSAAFIAAGFIGILSVVEYLYLKTRSDFQNKNFSKTHDSMNSTLLTIIKSIKEIKLNNKENFFTQKLEKDCTNFASLNKDRCFNNVFHIYFTEISVMTAFIAVLGGLFLSGNFNNSLLLTTLSTICVIILRLTPAINRAQSCLYSINSNEKLVLELFEFDDKFEKNFKYEKTKEKLPFKTEISFENVDFSYENSQKGLKNINFKIKKGEFIGIAGKSGFYKTTLALILSGLIYPNRGNILVDNILLNKDTIPKWQNNIAFFSQDFNLIFNDIYKNIALDENPNIDKIDEMIDFFFTEEEKTTLKSNNNINLLSTGQKQRIKFLNVLYNNKNVLILDEATSALDNISEEKIIKALKKLKGEKTIISIAHRLQALKYCDKIIFVNENGEIDFDTLENLKNKNPEFKKMFELSIKSLA